MKRIQTKQKTRERLVARKNPSVRAPTKKSVAKRKNNRGVKNRKANSLMDLDFWAAVEKGILEEITLSEQDVEAFFAAEGDAIPQARRDILRKLIILLGLASGDYAEERGLQNPKYHATEALVSAGVLINKMLIELAKRKSVSAAESVWDNAFLQISAIQELAMNSPNLLQPKARKSLRLPSFRAELQKYTDNFQLVSERLQLGADVGTKKGGTARYSLDAPTTSYAEKLLSEATAKRASLITLESAWMDGFGKKRWTKNEFLLKCPGVNPVDLALPELPSYCKRTAQIWWEKYFKPLLHQPGTLESLKGTNLYDNLLQAAKLKTDSNLLDDLKKACQARIVTSLAPDIPR